MFARPYAPSTGRFLLPDRLESGAADFALSSDPLTQNRYAWAGANPITNIEFDGHEPQESFDDRRKVNPMARDAPSTPSTPTSTEDAGTGGGATTTASQTQVNNGDGTATGTANAESGGGSSGAASGASGGRARPISNAPASSPGGGIGGNGVVGVAKGAGKEAVEQAVGLEEEISYTPFVSPTSTITTFTRPRGAYKYNKARVQGIARLFTDPEGVASDFDAKYLSDTEGAGRFIILIGAIAATRGRAGEGAASGPAAPRYVYRNGSGTRRNLTPRETDTDGVSTFDSLEKATDPGKKAQVIDTTKLTCLEACPSAPPAWACHDPAYRSQCDAEVDRVARVRPAQSADRGADEGCRC